MTAAHVSSTRRRPLGLGLGMHPVLALLVVGVLVHQLVLIAGVWAIVFFGRGLRPPLAVLALLLHIVTVSMVVGLVQWSRPRR